MDRPMPATETPAERKRRRRRFAASLAPLAVILIVGGALVASSSDGGVLEVVGYLALCQGIGLLGGIVPLAIGYNPLDKD
jgi:hypothetical protein